MGYYSGVMSKRDNVANHMGQTKIVNVTKSAGMDEAYVPVIV